MKQREYICCKRPTRARILDSRFDRPVMCQRSCRIQGKNNFRNNLKRATCWSLGANVPIVLHLEHWPPHTHTCKIITDWAESSFTTSLTCKIKVHSICVSNHTKLFVDINHTLTGIMPLVSIRHCSYADPSTSHLLLSLPSCLFPKGFNTEICIHLFLFDMIDPFLWPLWKFPKTEYCKVNVYDSLLVQRLGFMCISFHQFCHKSSVKDSHFTIVCCVSHSQILFHLIHYFTSVWYI
jgi:hypothetical protein